jgi:hypothetical protein
MSAAVSAAVVDRGGDGPRARAPVTRPSARHLLQRRRRWLSGLQPRRRRAQLSRVLSLRRGTETSRLWTLAAGSAATVARGDDGKRAAEARRSVRHLLQRRHGRRRVLGLRPRQPLRCAPRRRVLSRPLRRRQGTARCYRPASPRWHRARIPRLAGGHRGLARRAGPLWRTLWTSAPGRPAAAAGLVVGGAGSPRAGTRRWLPRRRRWWVHRRPARQGRRRSFSRRRRRLTRRAPGGGEGRS